MNALTLIVFLARLAPEWPLVPPMTSVITLDNPARLPPGITLPRALRTCRRLRRS
jgi:hypothetical protein